MILNFKNKELSERNNVPEKKCHSFGDRSDGNYSRDESFKSESLDSPSPQDQKSKEEEKKSEDKPVVKFQVNIIPPK